MNEMKQVDLSNGITREVWNALVEKARAKYGIGCLVRYADYRADWWKQEDKECDEAKVSMLLDISPPTPPTAGTSSVTPITPFTAAASTARSLRNCLAFRDSNLPPPPISGKVGRGSSSPLKPGTR